MSDFPAEQLLVAVFPGVPTAAELFLLPNKNQSEDKKKSEEELEQVWPLGCASDFGKKAKKDRWKTRCVCILQVSDVIVGALNQNLVEFELKPGVRVIVYNTQLTLGKKYFFFYMIFNTKLSYYLLVQLCVKKKKKSAICGNNIQ